MKMFHGDAVLSDGGGNLYWDRLARPEPQVFSYKIEME